MNKKYNVLDYDVKPNAEYLQTELFQKVIDVCRENGGGEIVVPKGNYRIGSIRLYSDMTLHLLEGAKLQGSTDYRDYEDFHVPSTLGYLKDDHYIKIWNLPSYYIYGIICAFGEKNVSIIGEKDSCINGNDCRDENGEERFRGPMGIILSRCEHIRLEGYSFINSANWSHQMDSCKGISISNVKIQGGHDGFNLHHCDDIEVADCTLETGDDCFAGYDIQNLHVKNCYMNTACNGLRIGGYHLIFENCVFEGPGHYPHLSENTYYTHALFKYYSIRPDHIRKEGEKIVIRNSVIKDVDMLFSYQYGKEELMQNNKPLRELVLENCRISGVKKAGQLRGNGETCTLVMKNIACDMEAGTTILETDEWVKLVLENVYCAQNVKIKAAKQPEQIRCSNIEIVQENKNEAI